MSAPAFPLPPEPFVFCAACRALWGAGGGVCGWAFAAAAELDARAWVGVAGACGAAEADVGAGGGGADERTAVESAAGEGASEVCRADDCGAAAEAVAGTSGDRVGSSASTLGAADRATGGGAASSTGAGAVKGFGGGARRGGTIRNPATAAAATIPTTISRDRVLFAGDSGALNLGALSLAPCLTARSAATCAA